MVYTINRITTKKGYKMSFTNEQLDQFIQDNHDRCVGLCEAWHLEIKSIEDLRQAADYLLNQI